MAQARRIWQRLPNNSPKAVRARFHHRAHVGANFRRGVSPSNINASVVSAESNCRNFSGADSFCSPGHRVTKCKTTPTEIDAAIFRPEYLRGRAFRRACINPRLRPRARWQLLFGETETRSSGDRVLTTMNSIFAKLRFAPGETLLPIAAWPLFVAAEIDSHRYKGGPDARSIRKSVWRCCEIPPFSRRCGRGKNCAIRARAICTANFRLVE